jgi:hypothetical protein
MINPALAGGRCDAVSITIVGKVNVSDIPMTQAELASMVEGGSELAKR